MVIISFKIFLQDPEIQHLTVMASVLHMAVVRGNWNLLPEQPQPTFCFNLINTVGASKI